MTRKCHSEERSDEESGFGNALVIATADSSSRFAGVGMKYFRMAGATGQQPEILRCAQNDNHVFQSNSAMNLSQSPARKMRVSCEHRLHILLGDAR